MTGTNSMVFQPANENVKANADSADLESSIADCIARLVHSFERIDDSDRAASIDRGVDQWEDDDFVYIETDAPLSAYIDIDINIHDGRVYIRLQK